MKQQLEENFIALLEKYKAMLYKISYAYTANAEDNKDLLQEMLISLWKAFPSFKNEAKLSTWVYRVALYTAITNYRRGKKQLRHETLQPDFYNISADDTWQPDVQLLYAAIEKLGPVDKAIILLLLDENSYAEISQVLGITPAAAGMRIKRAKDKLATHLINVKKITDGT